MAHAQSSNLVPKIERQVTASAGKNFVSTLFDIDGKELEYNIDCTIGDIAVRTLSYPDYAVVHQGYQQGALIFPKLNADEMLVYPNPTDDKITIKYNLDPGVKRVDVRVINLSGGMVFSEANTPLSALGTTYEYTLYVSDYLPGVYLVTIIFDTGIKVTRKFVKFDK
jgi:hypothetical protein